jgi:transcriptional regulator with XRE-family HTH domain
MSRKDLSSKVLYDRIFSMFPGESQKSVAEQLGVSEHLPGKWKNGISRPSLDVLNKVAEIKGLPNDWWHIPGIVRRTGADSEKIREDNHNIIEEMVREVSNLNAEVNRLRHQLVANTSLGKHEWPVRGLAAADDSGGRLAPIDDDFGNPVTPPPGLLLVPVQGDSMSPVVLPGQYVAIDQDREGFEVDGGIVVAYIEEPSGEDERRESMTGTFVKRCYRGDGGLYFASVNDYPPFSAWEDHCRIWPVIGVWFAGKGKPPVEG